MISEKHECIFVHVPKTGGQSVESVFVEENGLTWDTRAALLLRPKERHEEGPERLAHLTAAEYVSLGHIDRDRFDRYFKFAFVRNPWDRLISEYRFKKPGKPFPEWVYEIFSQDFPDTTYHIAPQVRFLTDDNGKFIVDFVGRFETLAEDFAKVAHKLGLAASLPKRNSTAGLFTQGYRKHYDATLRDRVGRYYEQDIERFGYRF